MMSPLSGLARFFDAAKKDLEDKNLAKVGDLTINVAVVTETPQVEAAPEVIVEAPTEEPAPETAPTEEAKAE